MLMGSKVTSIAKSGFKGEGVFTHLIPMSEVGPDIFLTSKVLERSGFMTKMVKTDTELIITIGYDENNRVRAAIVHSVDGHLPTTIEVSPEPVARPTITATIHQFQSPIKAGENLAAGEVLWRILDKDGQFIQYVVSDLVGNLLRQLGRVASNDARQNIGLEVKASKAKVVRRRDRVIAVSALLAAE